MKRLAFSYLEEWKMEGGRKPLLIRGARQVGKSHLVRTFGEKNFDALVEINFEMDPRFKDLFKTSLDPAVILKNIALITNIPITVGRTLLFFDEIQACPPAITALRYFYEKLPGLHVVAAGSLVEFALGSEEISMPVGRIQSLYLYPLSFAEFLEAKKENFFLDFIQQDANILKPIDDVVHKKGLSLVKEYALAGGMPEALASYLNEPAALKYRRIQQGLLQTFRDDFGKYARLIKHRYLDAVFQSAPGLIAKDYKYAQVERDIPSRTLKDALLLLEKAGILRRIKATSGAGLPLEVYADERKFKLMFLDIGLVQAALGLDVKLALAEEFIAINSGALAEQFVAQELLASSSPYEAKQQYFWTNNKRGSTAEVDFLYQYEKIIFPIEVKSGATGRLKSIRSFLGQYRAPFGIRISAHPLSYTDSVLSIPFYLLPALDKIIEQCLRP